MMIPKSPVLFLLCFLLAFPVLSQDDDAPITTENILQITELASFTPPAPIVLDAAASNTHLALTVPGGVVVYALDNLTEPLLVQPYDVLIENAADFHENRLALVRDEGVSVVDLATLEEIIYIETGYPPATPTFTPDGTRIATTLNIQALEPDKQIGLTTGGIDLWRIVDGAFITTLGYPFTYQGRVNPPPFAFSSDDRLLGSLSGRLHTWDTTAAGVYRDPFLYAKADYLALLDERRYTPTDALRYDWTAYQNENGAYALWLTADDTAIFTVQGGLFEQVTPGESGQNHDSDGLPSRINGYERLGNADLAGADLTQIDFNTSDETVRVIGLRDAAPSLPRYEYDSAADTLTDQQTGLIYEAVESEGVGQFIAPGGRQLGFLSGYYAAGEADLTAASSTLPEPVELMALHPDGEALAALNTTTDAGVLLIDSRTGATLLAYDDVGELRSTTLEFSGDLLMVSGLQDDAPALHFFDAGSGTRLMTLLPGSNYATFTPDGTRLVVYGRDVQIWGMGG